MHWSKSRHAQFAACPRQFFYEVIAGPRNPRIAELAEQTSGALIRHETVRQVISAIMRSPEPEKVPLSSLLSSAHVILSKAISDEYQAASQASIIDTCLESFVAAIPTFADGELLYVHQGDPVEFDYQGLSIMCLPELVLDYEDRTDILCWRTGQSRFRKPADTVLLAGGLTCWARSVLKLINRPIRIREVYLREDFASEDVSLTDQQLRDFVEEAKRVRAQYCASAKIRDFPARPGDVCRFCAFQSICPEYRTHHEVDWAIEALAQSVIEGNVGQTPGDTGEVKTFFLSHASEDKEQLVRPFARALEAAGIPHWLDEAEIGWGDSLTRKLNEGLRQSDYVIVFISDAFLGRGWPEAELGSAVAQENDEKVGRLLPIVATDWTKVVREYPLLRDKKHVKWSDGIDAIVKELKTLLSRAG